MSVGGEVKFDWNLKTKWVGWFGRRLLLLLGKEENVVEKGEEEGEMREGRGEGKE